MVATQHNKRHVASVDAATTAEAALQNRRLILASNRGPLEFYWDDRGRLESRRGSGGVVTALAALGRKVNLSWVASAMTDGDRAVAMASLEDDLSAATLGPGTRVRFVVSSPQEYDLYYNEFANPILWFVQHELTGMLPQKDFASAVAMAWRDGYCPVNRGFANVVLDELRRPDRAPIVMLHDYQLYLVAQYVREQVPTAVLQQFIHIPWPRPLTWQALPETIVRALCRGLLANDIVGFQTNRDASNFLATCEVMLPEATADFAGGVVCRPGHRTLVRSYPISIDVEAMQNLAASPRVREYERRVEALRGEQTIVRVDRLDPSKNVLAGFQAFARMLERRPDLRGRVKFLAFLVPSRSSIPEYKRYAEKVFQTVEEVNGSYGGDGWRPIEVFYQNNLAHAVAAMRQYDVLLVNSVLDGMNLVSKEGPTVNTRDGVLVLSRGAGSHEELGRYALSVSPQDVEGTALALEAALAMPRGERRLRATALRSVIAANDIDVWLHSQLADIGALLPGEVPGKQAGLLLVPSR